MTDSFAVSLYSSFPHGILVALWLKCRVRLRSRWTERLGRAERLKTPIRVKFAQCFGRNLLPFHPPRSVADRRSTVRAFQSDCIGKVPSCLSSYQSSLAHIDPEIWHCSVPSGLKPGEHIHTRISLSNPSFSVGRSTSLTTPFQMVGIRAASRCARRSDSRSVGLAVGP